MEHPYYEFKVLLVGDPAVGKTSLIRRFVEGRFEKEYKMSIGVDIFSKTVEVDDKVARLTLWDIASQERFARFRSAFYQQANGVLVVFDLTRPDTLESVEDWVREVKQYAGEVEVALVGNKNDLKNQRKIKREDVDPWVDRYDCIYVETSALTGDGVEEAFTSLCRAIAQHQQ